MKKTLSILLQLVEEGLLQRFAIGGAIAASFYVEAVSTEDLDIFAFLTPSPSGLLLLTPIYDRLKELGGVVHNEHIVIETWPVQILPAYTVLVEKAVLAARDCVFESLSVPVIDPEYLAAIALQTGRPKDFLRVHSLLLAGTVDPDKLHQLVLEHALEERWQTYVKRFKP
jgi:hypothetical protein